MSAGQFLLLALILVLIVAFVGLPWLAGRRKGTETFDSGAVYLEAIDALIHGRRAAAVEALRKLARHEADNPLAYLRLGDLVRTMGSPEKAERIHAGLLARPTADPSFGILVRESLLEDLAAQQKWDEVLRLGGALRSGDRKTPGVLRVLTLAHEARSQWDKAFETLDEWERLTPGRTLPRPAQLRIHVAIGYLREGRAKEARRLLEEAARLDGADPQARILLGDALARDGEHEKAAEQWLECVKIQPERSDPIFERLERSYFEMGRFGDLLPVYERLAQQNPGSAAASLAVADMHRRRGRPDEAIPLLESILASNPKSGPARRLLITCYQQARRSDSALREMDNLLRDLSAREESRPCVRCNVPVAELEPKCPSCGAWQPAMPPTAGEKGKAS